MVPVTTMGKKRRKRRVKRNSVSLNRDLTHYSSRSTTQKKDEEEKGYLFSESESSKLLAQFVQFVGSQHSLLHSGCDIKRNLKIYI